MKMKTGDHMFDGKCFVRSINFWISRDVCSGSLLMSFSFSWLRRHISCAAYILVVFALLTGCSSQSVVGYLDDHPEFSPVVSRRGKAEYQVIWSRSWNPIIYLKAHIEQDAFNKRRKAYISYSIENSVKSLKKVEISIADWNSIVAAVNESVIWEYDSDCDEKAYRDRTLYYRENNQCEEMLLTDGATITIAVTEESRSKAVKRACTDLGPCKPFGNIPLAMLKAIGKESLVY